MISLTKDKSLICHSVEDAFSQIWPCVAGSYGRRVRMIVDLQMRGDLVKDEMYTNDIMLSVLLTIESG